MLRMTKPPTKSGASSLRQGICQCICAVVVAPLDGFGVFEEELPPFASTSTSGRGVSGGESAVAVAGVYLSFQ